MASLPSEKALNERAPSPVDIEAVRNVSIMSSKAGQKILAHSHDADEAMKAFAAGEIIEITPEENKRLLRIIDRNLIPLMCIVYGLKLKAGTSNMKREPQTSFLCLPLFTDV